MDALSCLAHLGPEGEDLPAAAVALQADSLEVLGESPVQSWETLVRAGLDGLGSPGRQKIKPGGSFDDHQIIS